MDRRHRRRAPRAQVPERYEASARLYVDTQSLLRPLDGGNLDPAQSRPAGRAREPNAHQPAERRKARAHGRSRSLRKEPVWQRRRGRLGDEPDPVVGNPTNNLYTIAYRDPNPEQSRKVVQSLVTIFVESSLGDKREDTVNAVKFVDEQIKRYEAGLRAAEDRLKAFRLKYLGVCGHRQSGLLHASRRSERSGRRHSPAASCSGGVARLVQAGAGRRGAGLAARFRSRCSRRPPS